MKTRVTFPHPIVGVTVAAASAVIAAAGVSLSVQAVSCSDNVLIVTADRLLTANEKTAVAAAFRSLYPRIEDAPE